MPLKHHQPDSRLLVILIKDGHPINQQLTLAFINKITNPQFIKPISTVIIEKTDGVNGERINLKDIIYRK
jgi:hypothetical protein